MNATAPNYNYYLSMAFQLQSTFENGSPKSYGKWFSLSFSKWIYSVNKNDNKERERSEEEKEVIVNKRNNGRTQIHVEKRRMYKRNVIS